MNPFTQWGLCFASKQCPKAPGPSCVLHTPLERIPWDSFPEELALLRASHVPILRCAATFSPARDRLVLPFSLFLSLSLSPCLPSCHPHPRGSVFLRSDCHLGQAQLFWDFGMPPPPLCPALVSPRGQCCDTVALWCRAAEGPLPQSSAGPV